MQSGIITAPRRAMPDTTATPMLRAMPPALGITRRVTTPAECPIRTAISAGSPARPARRRPTPATLVCARRTAANRPARSNCAREPPGLPLYGGAAARFSFCRPGSVRHRAAGQPVKRTLQDENGGVLVDDPGTPGARDVGGDQFALDGGRGKPLVPEGNGKLRQPRKVAGER